MLHITSVAFVIFLQSVQVGAFIEEIFNHFTGGGGFQIEMDGGGRRKRMQPIKFPKHIPNKIHDSMSWLKGSEWNWNGWNTVRFNSDGSFVAPTEECQNPQLQQCRWSADQKGNVYIMWGSKSGLHTVKVSKIPKIDPQEDLDSQLSEVFMSGVRHSDGDSCNAKFLEIFDTEIKNAFRDLYSDLEVEPEADASTIKKAYRKLSIQYHPDKAGDDIKAKRRFERVTEANEVLSDRIKRLLYDVGGLELTRKFERGEIQKGPDANVQLQVDLEAFYTGKIIDSKIRRRIICRGCRQRPDSDSCGDCDRCPAEIQVVQKQVGPGFFVQQQEKVQSKEMCKNEDTKLHVEVKRGMKSGDFVTFEHAHDQSSGQLPGHIHFVLKQKIHASFTRLPNDIDLKLTIVVSLREALLGFFKQFEQLDGRKVLINQTNKITQPFEVIRLVGEGMPKKDLSEHSHKHDFGDLFVTVTVKFPKSLTKKQVERIEQLLSPADVEAGSVIDTCSAEDTTCPQKE